MHTYPLMQINKQIKNHIHTYTRLYIYIYIYIIRVLVVTKLLGGYMSNQVQYNMKSAICIYIYMYMYIYHHHHHYHNHHHVVPLAQISLTLSRHFSLSFITSGRSSGLHPVSSHSCCMYVRAGRPAFVRLYVGVHRST